MEPPELLSASGEPMPLVMVITSFCSLRAGEPCASRPGSMKGNRNRTKLPGAIARIMAAFDRGVALVRRRSAEAVELAANRLIHVKNRTENAVDVGLWPATCPLNFSFRGDAGGFRISQACARCARLPEGRKNAGLLWR